VREVGNELGLTAPLSDSKGQHHEHHREHRSVDSQVAGGGRRVEVMP